MSIQNRKEKIIIIDFGSQVTKLIARRIRELGVFSEVLTSKELYKIKDFSCIKGIILSGGPSTVTKSKYLNHLIVDLIAQKVRILLLAHGYLSVEGQIFANVSVIQFALICLYLSLRTEKSHNNQKSVKHGLGT